MRNILLSVVVLGAAMALEAAPPAASVAPSGGNAGNGSTTAPATPPAGTPPSPAQAIPPPLSPPPLDTTAPATGTGTGIGGIGIGPGGTDGTTGTRYVLPAAPPASANADSLTEFGSLDTDGDGLLSQVEMRASARYQTASAQMDTNADGRVSKREFFAATAASR